MANTDNAAKAATTGQEQANTGSAAAAAGAKKELPKYPKELTDKYNISGALQPAKCSMGSKFGNVDIDLRDTNKSCLEQVDAFVEKYGDKQKLFTPKNKS